MAENADGLGAVDPVAEVVRDIDLHHLGYFVPDIDAEIANMEQKGSPYCRAVAASAKDGSRAYA